MAENLLEQAAQGVPTLRGVLVTAMPDCLLYDSWLRSGDIPAIEEVASYFGDLVRSNRRALQSLGSWSSQMQVTIESADSLIVLRELNEHFVCGCIFERDVPLGMVRLHMNRMIEQITAGLPQIEIQERPRAVRVIEFLHRYAPDPHAVLMRVALRAQLTPEQLDAPEGLDADQSKRLENAAAQLLGLEKLNL